MEQAKAKTSTVASTLAGPAKPAVLDHETAPPLQAGEDVVCPMIHPSFVNGKGIILQFINNNCQDAASVIGGVRLNFAEIHKLPAYLTRHHARVKQHAISNLTRHLIENQCPVGALESLTPDDYSMSFMVASVSPVGLGLNPSKRSEGPMFYCLFSGLVEKKYLDFYSGSVDSAHIINVYIHLHEASRRRSVAIAKAREDRLKAVEDAAAPAPSPARPIGQRVTTTQVSTRRPYQVPPPNTDLQSVKDSVSTLVKEVRKMALPGNHYPEMPSRPPIQWPSADRLPDMPDDL